MGRGGGASGSEPGPDDGGHGRGNLPPDRTDERSRRWPLGWLALAGAAIVVGLWLADAAGHGVGRGLARDGVGLAALPIVAWLGRAFARLWRRDDGPQLLLLLGLGLGLALIGLEHEIAGRSFGDEGAYLAHAQRINDGQLLRGWFVYPHLLFYLDAIALWLADLAAPVTRWLARALYGVEGDLEVAALVSRLVTALFAGLVVLPAAALARRIAPPERARTAALVAGLAIALSPLWQELTHLNLGDVPAAFFATLTLALAARLLDVPSRRGYLLAGLAAGLAAGSKYPAGLVAVAIAAVWLRDVLRRQRLNAGLLWAALAAVAAFLAATPSLLAFPKVALAGGEGSTGLFFGARLYAEAGWAGVVRGSEALYYGQQLLVAFGPALLAIGLLGLATLRRRGWARLAWLLPFPVLFAGLITAMKIVVPRNLLPLLPFIAALLAIGVVGATAWLGQRLGPWFERTIGRRPDRTAAQPAERTVGRPAGRRRPRPPARRVAAALLVALCLLPPALASAGLLTRLARPTTRDLAAAWAAEHIPPGAFIVQEAYTPQLATDRHWQLRAPRFAIRLTPDELRDPTYDFLFVASEAYNRFLRGKTLVPGNEEPARRYRQIFDTFPLVRQWQPGPYRAGPVISLYHLGPTPPIHATEADLTAADATLSRDGMSLAGAAGAPAGIHFAAPDAWALFKPFLAAGRYRLAVTADPPDADTRLRILSRNGDEITDQLLTAAAGTPLTLPRDDKYFIYLTLAPGATLDRLTLRPHRSTPPAAPGR